MTARFVRNERFGARQTLVGIQKKIPWERMSQGMRPHLADYRRDYLLSSPEAEWLRLLAWRSQFRALLLRRAHLLAFWRLPTFGEVPVASA